MDENTKKLSLKNLGCGGAVEQFNVELQKVLENIEDEHTKATAVREITLKIKILPNENRNNFNYLVEAKSKLAPIKGFGGVAFLRRDQGTIVAYEANEKQMDLPYKNLTDKKMEVINNG